MMPEMHLVSPRVLAIALTRLLSKQLSPVAEAAVHHEKDVASLFVRSVKAARETVDMKHLESVLALGHSGTGAPLYVCEEAIRALEVGLMGAELTHAERFAAKRSSSLPEALSGALTAGAEANEFCVVNTEIGKQDQKTLNEWMAFDPKTFNQMRKPTTKLGKELAAALDKLPVYDGVSYRGVSISDDALQSVLEWQYTTIKLQSSASTSRAVAVDFMDYNSTAASKDVIFEFHGRAADLRSKLGEDYKETEEVIIRAGSVWRKESVTERNGVTHVVFHESR